MGQGPQRFPHISTADSAVGPPHPDRLDGKEQAIRGNGRAMALARRDEDRLAWPCRERPRFELHDQLALEHEKELVARLTVPAPVEPSGARMQDRHTVDRADLRVRPCGRRAQWRLIGGERVPEADLSAHARIVE
jgi:hypothetical protein